MDLSQDDLADSEDEIFFGKLTLSEVRKHLVFDNKQRHTIACVNLPEDETDSSLQLIETHSEPDYVSIRDSLMEDSPQKPCELSKQSICSIMPEDSFLQFEKIVSNMTSENGKVDEMDNTLEIVEYILKHGPGSKLDVKENADIDKTNNTDVKIITDDVEHESPMKTAQVGIPIPSAINFPASPCMSKAESKHFTTPHKDTNIQTTIFKTPANTLMPKKPSSTIKKTPSRNLKYQHIMSPVASYIKNCPQVPLVQDVHPKKPLPGPSSSIPKFVKCTSQINMCNKENVNLPSLAYKSAKETKTINLPCAGKLPESQWAKKIVSSLPRPVVIKHKYRENNLLKKVHPNQEDSFADLSLHQADVSVCTQKSAFCKP